MPDREKVIGDLEGLTWDDWHEWHSDSEVRQIAKDAIELLKEQGTKTGHWIDTTKVIGFPRVQCSVCGSGQGAIWMDYCPNCGAKMEGL